MEESKSLSLIQKKNQLIKQHNNLTGAKYHLTATQKNIIYLLLSQISSGDEPNKIYKFHISHLYTKKREAVNYTRIKQDIDGLLKQRIEIKTPTGWIKFPAIISSIEYIENEGIFEAEISSKIRPYLFGLQNNFTTFWSQTALEIKTVNAKRIYEMLSQYKDTGVFIIGLLELKERLYLFNYRTREEQYPIWSRFKDRILDRAKKDLKDANADIQFDYEPVKSGKKVVSLKFKIQKVTRVSISQSKSQELALKEEGVMRNFKRLVEKFRLSAWQARIIVDNIPMKDINKVLHEIQIQKINNKIANIGGYTIKVFFNRFPDLFAKLSSLSEY